MSTANACQQQLLEDELQALWNRMLEMPPSEDKVLCLRQFRERAVDLEALIVETNNKDTHNAGLHHEATSPEESKEGLSDGSVPCVLKLEVELQVLWNLVLEMPSADVKLSCLRRLIARAAALESLIKEQRVSIIDQNTYTSRFQLPDAFTRVKGGVGSLAIDYYGSIDNLVGALNKWTREVQETLLLTHNDAPALIDPDLILEEPSAPIMGTVISVFPDFMDEFKDNGCDRGRIEGILAIVINWKEEILRSLLLLPNDAPEDPRALLAMEESREERPGTVLDNDTERLCSDPLSAGSATQEGLLQCEDSGLELQGNVSCGWQEEIVTDVNPGKDEINDLLLFTDSAVAHINPDDEVQSEGGESRSLFQFKEESRTTAFDESSTVAVQMPNGPSENAGEVASEELIDKGDESILPMSPPSSAPEVLEVEDNDETLLTLNSIGNTLLHPPAIVVVEVATIVDEAQVAESGMSNLEEHPDTEIAVQAPPTTPQIQQESFGFREDNITANEDNTLVASYGASCKSSDENVGGLIFDKEVPEHGKRGAAFEMAITDEDISSVEANHDGEPLDLSACIEEEDASKLEQTKETEVQIASILSEDIEIDNDSIVFDQEMHKTIDSSPDLDNEPSTRWRVPFDCTGIIEGKDMATLERYLRDCTFCGSQLHPSLVGIF